MTKFVVAVAVMIVALMSGGAMAVRSASRIWLRHWAESRLRGSASVLLYLERPQRLLAAANTAAALVICMVGIWFGWRGAVDHHLDYQSLIWCAVWLIFVGQLVPRAIARRWPAELVPLLMPLLRVAHVLTVPLLAIVRRPPSRVERLGALDASHEAMNDLLREGELEGVGKHDEIAIISGVMQFGEKMVRDVMTPRAEVFALAETLDARSVAVQIADSKFSRVPVYRDSLDTIIGMYHVFDVIKERAEKMPPLRPVAYAPWDSKCNELLFRMLRARLHLAVVHDERGHTLGIATLENLLEELVGDIRDEHDEPAAATEAATAPPR